MVGHPASNLAIIAHHLNSHNKQGGAMDLIEKVAKAMYEAETEPGDSSYAWPAAHADDRTFWLTMAQAAVNAVEDTVGHAESEWQYGVGWRWGKGVLAFACKDRAAAEAHVSGHPLTDGGEPYFVTKRTRRVPAGEWLEVPA